MSLMMIRPVSVSLLFLFLLGSALNAQNQKIGVRPGIWKGAGNAELWVIDQDRYQSYQLTSVSCIPIESGPSKEILKAFDADTIESWSEERLVLSGYDYRATYDRLRELPEPCRATHDANDPVYNFNVFWQYFRENYPSFELRNIDWDAMRRTYQPRIKPGMSEKEFFAVLGEMVEKINDPHVFVSNGKKGAEDITYGSPDPHGLAAAVRAILPGKTTKLYRAAARNVVDAIETEIRYELLRGDFHSAHNDRLTWGMLTRNVGYLRSSLSVGLFGPGLSREQRYEQLDATLDTIFTDFRTAKALIIDVTTNTGGANFITDSIARRVIQEPIVAYQARTKTPNGFDELFVKRLEPAKGPRFSGPVVVLMSSNTVSAGEALPMVLHGLPNVTLFGETTLGATGSFLILKLPNGGRVGVAHDVYTDRNGVWYEKRGIPPDVRAVTFDPTKLVTGYREFVSSAVKLVESKLKEK
jgi:Peptidase family S41/Tricorn protease C1 domain